MRRFLAVLAILLAAPAAAADYPEPQEGDWIARDFKFRTGEVTPELRLHYRTIGDRKNPAVLMLHGTTGSGASLLTAGFAGELFGAGQPLDRMLDQRLAAPFAADANDYLYQWESSGNYDPTPLLPRIAARVLLINSADDERNRRKPVRPSRR